MEPWIDPTPDFPHGKELGYRKGCKCDPCRLAHKVKVQEDRASRKAKLPKEPPPPRGHMERTVRRELKEASACQPPWVQTMHALAIALAQQIDRATGAGGKESVISPLTARLMQVLDRIRVAGPAKGDTPAGVGDEAEDFVNGLTPMG